MKELSIEEKAKRYDEALKRARKIENGEPINVPDGTSIPAAIFPELYELEDERIRKQIISFLKEFEYDHYRCLDFSSWIAWLEKQGEQKPVDKVEPKFKVGDWVVFKNKHQSIYQVEKIEDGYYNLRHTHGGTFGVLHDEDLRLWTIEDAKAGDVLSFNDGHGNDCIELIKSITGKNIEFWFCLTNGNCYEVFDGITPYTNLVSRKDAIPATKEQRDTLLAKIKEAGYEWDADKKELIKL